MHETKYALIKGTTVENIVVADLDFIQIIQKDWDFIEEVNTKDDPRSRVSIGWQYVNGEFIEPVQEPPNQE